MKFFAFGFALLAGLGGVQTQSKPLPNPLREAKYVIQLGGRNVGTATITQKLLTSGGKELGIRMNLVDGTNSVQVRQTSSWAADGSLIKKFQEITTTSPKAVKSKSAQISATQATLASDENGARNVTTLRIAKGASVKAISEFWFFRDEPELNQKCTYWDLNLNKSEWERTDATYMGEKKVKVNGRSVSGFLVKVVSDARITESVFDSDGLPILIEDQAGLKVIREGFKN